MSEHREDNFLVDWVLDPHARRILLKNGVLLVDNFRDAILDGRAIDHARSVVPPVYEQAIDEAVAVRLYAAAAALMARLSCSEAAACVAEEMLAAYLVIQCTGDLEHMPEWQHLTDDQRAQAIRRAGFWQSVTGSLDRLDEPLAAAAAREVMRGDGHRRRARPPAAVERGLYLRDLSALAPPLRAGRSAERRALFGLELPARRTVCMAPQEHVAFAWLPWREAAAKCFSWSNRDAIVMLGRANGGGRWSSQRCSSPDAVRHRLWMGERTVPSGTRRSTGWWTTPECAMPSTRGSKAFLICASIVSTLPLANARGRASAHLLRACSNSTWMRGAWRSRTCPTCRAMALWGSARANAGASCSTRSWRSRMARAPSLKRRESGRLLDRGARAWPVRRDAHPVCLWCAQVGGLAARSPCAGACARRDHRGVLAARSAAAHPRDGSRPAGARGSTRSASRAHRARGRAPRETYAPSFDIATAADYDRFGELRWRCGRAHAPSDRRSRRCMSSRPMRATESRCCCSWSIRSGLRNGRASAAGPACRPARRAGLARDPGARRRAADL